MNQTMAELYGPNFAPRFVHLAMRERSSARMNGKEKE